MPRGPQYKSVKGMIPACPVGFPCLWPMPLYPPPPPHRSSSAWQSEQATAALVADVAAACLGHAVAAEVRALRVLAPVGTEPAFGPALAGYASTSGLPVQAQYVVGGAWRCARGPAEYR